MCNCAARREKIVIAASAILKGDLATAKAAAQFVVASAAQDVANSARRLAAHRRMRR